MNDNFCIIFAIIWFITGTVFGFVYGSLEYFRMAMIMTSVYSVGHIIVFKIKEK